MCEHLHKLFLDFILVFRGGIVVLETPVSFTFNIPNEFLVYLSLKAIVRLFVAVPIEGLISVAAVDVYQFEVVDDIIILVDA